MHYLSRAPHSNWSWAQNSGRLPCRHVYLNILHGRNVPRAHEFMFSSMFARHCILQRKVVNLDEWKSCFPKWVSYACSTFVRLFWWISGVSRAGCVELSTPGAYAASYGYRYKSVIHNNRCTLVPKWILPHFYHRLAHLFYSGIVYRIFVMKFLFSTAIDSRMTSVWTDRIANLRSSTRELTAVPAWTLLLQMYWNKTRISKNHLQSWE